MRHFHLLLLAAGIAALAGCMTDDAGTDDTGGEGNETRGNMSARNETTSIPIQFPATGPVPGPLGPGNRGDVEVPENASALLVEARWECTTPTCDFDVVVYDAEGNEASRGSGSGEATVSVEMPAAGTWQIGFEAGAPAAQVTGEVRATWFVGDVPEGFTAWDEEAEA